MFYHKIKIFKSCIAKKMLGDLLTSISHLLLYKHTTIDTDDSKDNSKDDANVVSIQ